MTAFGFDRPQRNNDRGRKGGLINLTHKPRTTTSDRTTDRRIIPVFRASAVRLDRTWVTSGRSSHEQVLKAVQT